MTIEVEDDAFKLEVVKHPFRVNIIPFQEIVLFIGVGAVSIAILGINLWKK